MTFATAQELAQKSITQAEQMLLCSTNQVLAGRIGFLLFRDCFFYHTGCMKSAYELAMERLNKVSPTVKLTEEQKKKLAELDSKYAAKIAERELGLKDEIAAAAGAGDFEKVEQLEKQLVLERKKLQTDLEEKKEEIRQLKK